MTTKTGYLSAEYAESLREFGEPRPLRHAGGWVLKRAVPGTALHDAMGCYPLFSCEDWSALDRDLTELSEELLTLAVVPDPFAPLSAEELGRLFDVVVPFKNHYVYDLSRPLEKSATKHHRYYGRKALGAMKLERCEDLAAFLPEWVELYGVLAARHGLSGIKAFSTESFRRQLEVPGLVAIRGTHDGKTVAGHLWFVQGDVAYSHLVGVSEEGYLLNASYGLYQYAITYFAEHFDKRVKWLDLGGGAGVKGEGRDGLTDFKKGWGGGTRQAYFCGRTLDRARYEAVTAARGGVIDSYFPAYRRGEFGAAGSPRGERDSHA